MRQRTRAWWVAVFQTAVGVGLLVYGAATRNWWSAAIGLLVLGVRLGAVLIKGESWSWPRGDLDERRQHVVDLSYRFAFFVLALWVTGVSVVAASGLLPLLAPLGIVVAVSAAYLRYAVLLRRT
ncbi:MAG: hypothetical protein ACJ735_00235 [Actinomycetes bacterium]